MQIKLLQGAANAYNFMEDVAFDRWFDSILILDEREAYKLSCTIEIENINMQSFIVSPSNVDGVTIARQTKWEQS